MTSFRMLGKGADFTGIFLPSAGYQQKGPRWTAAANGLQQSSGAELTEHQSIPRAWCIYPPIYPPRSRSLSPMFSQDLFSSFSPTRRSGGHPVTPKAV